MPPVHKYVVPRYLIVVAYSIAYKLFWWYWNLTFHDQITRYE